MDNEANIKVLHLIDTLWLGGAQTLLKAFFEDQPENHTIFLYALRDSGIRISINHPNIAIDKSGKRLSPGRIKRVLRFARQNKIGILHCHLPHSQAVGWVIKSFYQPDIKLIFHDHSDVYEPNWKIGLFLRIAIKKADHIIACSKGVKEKLVERAKANPGKISVLYNFIVPEKFTTEKQAATRTEERKKLNIPESAFIVGFAGRLVKRKGWKEFIEAAALLQGINNLWFLIAGTGPDEKKMIQAINGKSNILWLGYQANMSTFYSTIDCFVMPSHWEGMPLALLESQVFNLPVVCAKSPGLKEFMNYLPDGFIPCMDSQALSEKIKEYITEIPALSRNRQMLNHFTLEIFKQKLGEIYNPVFRKSI